MAAPQTGIQLDTAELVGVLIESVLFGVSIVYGSKTFRYFLFSKRRESSKGIFFATLLILITFAVVHLIVDWHRMIVAFIESPTRLDRILFLADYDYSRHNFKNSWTNLFKFLTFVLQTFIADFIMAYRCYILWKPNLWIALLPAITSLATLVGGIGAIGISLKSNQLFLGQLSNFITVFWSATVATNVLATGFILLKLWLALENRRENKMTSANTFSLKPVIIVLLESGTLYLSICIVTFALYERGSNIAIVTTGLLPPFILILFSFVLLSIVDRKGYSSTSTNTYHNHHASPNASGGTGTTLSVRKQPMTFAKNKRDPNRTYDFSGSQSMSVDVEMSRFEHAHRDPSMDQESYEYGTEGKRYELGHSNTSTQV